jgi:plasmid maintenance system killer protein
LAKFLDKRAVKTADTKPTFSQAADARPIKICARRQSNHFEKLRGKLEGFHPIRVNSPWRLIFRWDGRRGEASGVYLDDHSYR